MTNLTTKHTKETILAAIDNSFKTLGFEPRPGQVDIIYSAVDAFLNRDKTTVVLDVPTGGGKSLIGAVIAEVINDMTPEINALGSIISMPVNSLAKQYAETFSTQPKYKVFQIRGASTYPCNYMEMHPGGASNTAEECVKKSLLPVEEEKYCRGCEYDESKKIMNSTDNLITNSAYFFTSQLSSGHLIERKLHIFDESHLLNHAFCSFTEIVVDSATLDKQIKELSNTNGKCDNESAALVMLKDRVAKNTVHESNYMEILGLLQELYKSVASTMNSQAGLLESQDLVASAKMSKIASKYKRLQNKIKDLFTRNYDHVFDSSETSFSVKPIFIGELMPTLMTRYNLLMSATITREFCLETLMLNPDTTEYIQAPAVFPAKNKPILFIGNTALNYNSLKEKSVIDTLKSQVSKIVNFHKDQKGLILAPSFYLGSSLVWGLKGTRVFEHKSGVNLPDLILEFKRYSGAAVLVSPSIFEGLDFSGDDSRFQIVVKTPYASLGDKRVKYIADNYPNIYREDALIKIIQGAGRGVRSPTDFSHTYCLDASSKKLFNSSKNIWANQFTVMSK